MRSPHETHANAICTHSFFAPALCVCLSVSVCVSLCVSVSLSVFVLMCVCVFVWHTIGARSCDANPDSTLRWRLEAVMETVAAASLTRGAEDAGTGGEGHALHACSCI